MIWLYFETKQQHVFCTSTLCQKQVWALVSTQWATCELLPDKTSTEPGVECLLRLLYSLPHLCLYPRGGRDEATASLSVCLCIWLIKGQVLFLTRAGGSWKAPFIWLFPGRGPPRWQSRCVRRLRLGSVMWTCEFHYHTLRKRYLESSLLNHLYVLGPALLFHVSLCLSQHHTSLSLSLIAPWVINTEPVQSFWDWLLARSQVSSCPVQLNDTHLPHARLSSPSLQRAWLPSWPYMGKVRSEEAGRSHWPTDGTTAFIFILRDLCVFVLTYHNWTLLAHHSFPTVNQLLTK